MLQVFYLPNGPGRFKHTFSIQVAHFEPDTIHLYGEAIYPNLILALPRDHSDMQCRGYTDLLDVAVDNVTRRVNNLDPNTSIPKALLPFHRAILDTGHTPLSLVGQVSIEDYFKAGYSCVRFFFNS